jgi:hypothetical protein
LLGSLWAAAALRGACKGIVALARSLRLRTELRRLRQAMHCASSYEEWVQAAVAADALKGQTSHAASPQQVWGTTSGLCPCAATAALQLAAIRVGSVACCAGTQPAAAGAARSDAGAAAAGRRRAWADAGAAS